MFTADLGEALLHAAACPFDRELLHHFKLPSFCPLRRFVTIVEHLPHLRRGVIFRRICPAKPFLINRTAFLDLNDFVIHKKTIVLVHEGEVTRIICSDNWLTEKHCFGQA